MTMLTYSAVGTDLGGLDCVTDFNFFFFFWGGGGGGGGGLKWKRNKTDITL